MAVETQYAYAVARVRAVEKKLLDKGKLDRMIETKTSEEALKVVLESDYGISSGELSSIYEYERLLKEEMQKVYLFLAEIAPEPKIFDIFLQRNDYHNVKVILKSEFLGSEQMDALMDASKIPVNKMKVMIKDRNFIDMPKIMRNAVEECIDTFNRTADPQTIDIILDKANFIQMKESAKEVKNKFLNDFVEKSIDLTNIKMFLRVKAMKKSWDFLQKMLLSGGRIDLKIFIDNIESSLENIVELLRYSPYGEVAEKGIEAYRTTGSMAKLEKICDDYLMSFVKSAKFISLGLEPLIGYLVAKENEIRNVRIIMVGKINKLSNENIRERLREAYV